MSERQIAEVRDQVIDAVIKALGAFKNLTPATELDTQLFLTSAEELSEAADALSASIVRGDAL
jgi:hypothetical protein